MSRRTASEPAVDRRQASAFVATTAYRHAVLNGTKVASVAAARGVGMPAAAVLLDVGAVAVAIGAVAWLDWNRLQRGRTADVGDTILGNAVRRLHAGSLGDSVAWTTLGAAVIALALATTLH